MKLKKSFKLSIVAGHVNSLYDYIIEMFNRTPWLVSSSSVDQLSFGFKKNIKGCQYDMNIDYKGKNGNAFSFNVDLILKTDEDNDMMDLIDLFNTEKSNINASVEKLKNKYNK